MNFMLRLVFTRLLHDVMVHPLHLYCVLIISKSSMVLTFEEDAPFTLVPAFSIFVLKNLHQQWFLMVLGTGLAERAGLKGRRSVPLLLATGAPLSRSSTLFLSESSTSAPIMISSSLEVSLVLPRAELKVRIIAMLCARIFHFDCENYDCDEKLFFASTFKSL